MKPSDDTGPPRVLYLLTDEISAVLVRGQLGFLVGEGFEVTVATRLATPGVPKAGRLGRRRDGRGRAVRS